MTPAFPRDDEDRERLLDVVFERRAKRPAWSLPAARLLPWLIAIAAHGILWFAAAQSEPSLEAWSARMALLVHRELEDSAPTELFAPPSSPQKKTETPEAPEPEADPQRPPEGEVPDPPPANEQPSEPPPTERPAPDPTSTPVEEPLPDSLAQAGEVVTRAPDSAEPVDLTDHTFVTGEASAYAGGVSVRGGTSSTAVQEGPTARRRRAPETGRTGSTRSGEGSRARPVRLPENEWDCPWPEAAVDEEIYEQSVILRVVVRRDGSVESAKVLDDPGHGFGEAALACARSTRFAPARDATGNRIRAVSPPIRVRFTR